MIYFISVSIQDAQCPKNISGQDSPAANVQDEMAPNESEAEGMFKKYEQGLKMYCENYI